MSNAISIRDWSVTRAEKGKRRGPMWPPLFRLHCVRVLWLAKNVMDERTVRVCEQQMIMQFVNLRWWWWSLGPIDSAENGTMDKGWFESVRVVIVRLLAGESLRRFPRPIGDSHTRWVTHSLHGLLSLHRLGFVFLMSDSSDWLINFADGLDSLPTIKMSYFTLFNFHPSLTVRSVTDCYLDTKIRVSCKCLFASKTNWV